MASELYETVDSETESEETIQEETAKKGLTWGQKTLMYCGIGVILFAIAWIVYKLYKPRFVGVLTKIKQLLNIIKT